MPEDLTQQTDDWLKARLWELHGYTDHMPGVYERRRELEAELHRRRTEQQKQATIRALGPTT